MASFDIAYPIICEIEGYVSNHPLDPGGYTVDGLTQKDLSDYGMHIPIWQTTKEQRKEIHRAIYWGKMGLDYLDNQQIATMLYATGLNQGVVTCIKWVQENINIMHVSNVPLSTDGIMGNLTILALNNLPDYMESAFIESFCHSRVNRYKQIVSTDPAKVEFYAGWMRNVRLSRGGKE